MATKIQSIEARQMFPCWDEPALKTRFEININHHKRYRVLSNVRRIQITEDALRNNRLWTTFIIPSLISTRQMAIALIDASKSYDEFDKAILWNRYGLQSTLTGFATEVMQNISNLEFVLNSEVSVNMFEIDQIVVPGIKYDIIGKWGLVIYK
jgi:hypothetical protein